MKFLLVLSDAFDALWAIRGRVALALAGTALLGVLAAVYLPMMRGSEPSPPPAVAAHSPTVQGPVEPAKVVPQAAVTAPAPAATSPAPASQAAAATDPGSTPVQATVPEQASAPAEQASKSEQASAPQAAAASEPASAPQAAPTPAAEPVYRVQVGAFREVERARQLSRRLTRAGFPNSVIRGTTPDGKTIYRVRTRQALAKGEARQLVARLRHRVPALRPILVPGGEATG